MIKNAGQVMGKVSVKVSKGKPSPMCGPPQRWTCTTRLLPHRLESQQNLWFNAT